MQRFRWHWLALLAVLGALVVGLLPVPTYAAERPTVTSLSVTSGPAKGGTKLTVHGSGFTKASSVRFGTVAGKKVHITSTTTLTVTAPKHAAGAVQVQVTAAGGSSASGPDSAYTYYAPVKVTTKTLHPGIAGSKYLENLVASGGTEPYRWTARSLPAGLSLSSAGVLSGVPVKKASKTIKVALTDAHGQRATRSLKLKVPTALPTPCLDASCAVLSADTYTVPVSANQVGDVGRDEHGVPDQVLLTGVVAHVGDTLVIAPNSHAPSGLVVGVTSVTPRGDGTTVVDVTRLGPAAAFAEGTVVETGPAVTPVSGAQQAARAVPHTIPARRATKGAKPHALAPRRPSSEVPRVSVECDGGVSSELHGLSVTPALTPSIALQWKRNFLGIPKIYDGPGGLDLFQVDLDGTITVDLGVTVSGSSTCTLTLPSYQAVVPAGPAGAVVLDVTPHATFKVTGKIDLRTSVVFGCGAEYRRSGSHETRSSYCHVTNQPLGLSSDSGIDATLTGSIEVAASLDDIVGVTGTLTASVHAGFHPEQHPLVKIDGKVTFELTGCLVCFWKGSPLHVTIISATLFQRDFYTLDRAPDPVPDAGPPVIASTALPAATLGQPYSARLLTTDNRQGAWSLSSGSLPDGLDLDGDTISGKARQTGGYDFTVAFVDGAGRATSRPEHIDVVRAGGAGGGDEGGALQNLDYCRSNILPANDDGSTDSVDLPFAVALGGTSYSSTYVNNNGYLTFQDPSGQYTPPSSLSAAGQPIVAPFYADVDTRDPGSALVTYGASPDGHSFCVDWVDVGYYNEHVDKTNSFQLIISDRSDVSPGDVDLTYNYGHVDWETGDASNGQGGIGGTSARVGYFTGADGATGVELPGSGESGTLLDGAAHALRAGSLGTSVAGRYVFPVRS